ncbi:MAG: 30S ribosomal protein S3 [Parcubacteria group bacterium GW2011_GWF2_39_13b]|nr:MAG: 30S ribosomal protein S3 [Parcubacteria group bacterium GW2011_GWF2_39_13b]
MGQKVHPTSFRTGIIFDWKSRWFNKKKYKEYLAEDVKIRDFIFSKLIKAGLGKVEIERAANAVRIIIFTSRPGLIIGRGGAGVEQLRAELQKIIAKSQPKEKIELRLEIEEIKQAESFAPIVAQNIAEQLEKRLPYRRVIKQTLERILQGKAVQGAKIMVKGRLDGSEIARKEWLGKGRIPLQTLRANIDFGRATANTTYGTIGVKVWVYKGDI